MSSPPPPSIPPPSSVGRKTSTIRAKKSVRRMIRRFRRVSATAKSEIIESLVKVLDETYTAKHFFRGVGGADPRKDCFEVRIFDSKGGVAGRAYAINRGDGLTLHNVNFHPNQEYNKHKIVNHLRNYAESISQKKIKTMEKSESKVLSKGDVIDFGAAKARLRRNPFTKKKDLSKLPTKEKIQAALDEQAEKGSPYAVVRDPAEYSHPPAQKPAASDPAPAPASTSRLPVHARERAERMDRIRSSMGKISQLRNELEKLKSYRGDPSDDDVEKDEMTGKPKPKTAWETLNERHPGEIPHDHPDREKMASYVTKLNQTPGKRGFALQLYERFLGGKGYTKGEKELLSSLIKAEITGDL